MKRNQPNGFVAEYAMGQSEKICKLQKQIEQLEKDKKGLKEALKKIVVDCWIPRIKEITIQALQERG